MPTWDEVKGKKRSYEPTKLPIQPKEIGSVSLAVLLRLAKGTPEEEDMIESWRQLCDPQYYVTVDGVKLSDSRCSLTAEQVDHMIKIKHWAPLTAEQVKRIKGVCRIFTVDEIWKGRARLISWTYTINQAEDLKPEFDMFHQHQVRFFVHEGNYGYSIDGRAAFQQLEYDAGPTVAEYRKSLAPEGETTPVVDGDDAGDGVSLYHCVLTCKGWVRLCRGSMGSRGMPKACHTCLKVLTSNVRSSKVDYVDNTAGANNSKLQLVEDLEGIRERAAEANYTFGEDLTKPMALIKTEIELLGLILDFTSKRVKLVQKVLAKLAAVWERYESWTVHDFIVCMCILQYTATVLGQNMAKWQVVLQRWARAQGECFHDPDFRNATYDRHDNPEVEDLLHEWVLLTMENEWVAVPKENDTVADFIMITDASKDFWASIMISCSSGQATLMHGAWPGEVAEIVKSSSNAEPAAVYAAALTFIEPSAKMKVKHIGDNLGTKAEINRGHSTKDGRFLAEVLAEAFPNVEFSSSFWEGATIATDEQSRGREMVRKKLKTMMDAHHIDLSGIRDWAK